jgi:GntR family transcriptional regulator, arabinose operon transcriptional repressor
MDTKKELLYETIVDALKSRIRDGTYKSDDRLPTEMELASEYNVSRITSKRALEELKNQGLVYRIRGSGTFVSGEGASAQTVRQGSNIVAIILPFDVSNGSFALSVRGLSEVLESNGYYLSVYNGVRDVKAVEILVSRLYNDHIRGIIYYPLSDRDNFGIMNMLHLENYPIVTIDKYFESIPISYVVSDNEAGASKAVEYLIDLGHRRIGFVSDLLIESITSIRNRYFGYCKTLKEHHLPYDPELVKLGVTGNEFGRSYSKEIYQPLVKEFVSLGATALFAINDLIASYLMRAAFELDIRVPGDISIIGFDDMDIAKHLQVPLTTVSQDFYSIGKVAGQIVCKSIQSGTITYTQKRLGVELVIRDSCRKISD